METIELEKYIKGRDVVTIPEVQAVFSLGYKEVRELFAKLEKIGSIRLEDGLYYTYSKNGNTAGNVMEEIIDESEKLSKTERRAYSFERNAEILKRMEAELKDSLATEDEENDDDEEADEEADEDDDDFEVNEKLRLRILDFCISYGSASPSLLQHRFGLGFIASCKIIDWFQDKGYATEPMGIRGSRMLITREEFTKLYGSVDLSEDDEEEDEKERELKYRALEYSIATGFASVSMLQRRYPIGYSKACRLVSWMESKGFVSVANDSRPRRVLINREEFKKLAKQANYELDNDDDEEELLSDEDIKGLEEELLSDEDIKLLEEDEDDEEDDFLKDIKFNLFDDDDEEENSQPIDVSNLISVLKRVIDKKSAPITTDKEPDCSLWTDKIVFRGEVLRRFNSIIKSNPKQGLGGAVKTAEARLEGVRDSHDRAMVQIYERVVYEFKCITPYYYNLIRRRLCGN
ncbi:MAG: DNA translocase FtsK [Candidatus Coproplasma sp.]